MEKEAYILLGIVMVAWLAAMVIGLVVAFPYGLLGLLVLLAIGLLLVKVFRERLQNREDDYYSKHVDQ